MSEVDERRIAEIAKEPPRVLRGVPQAALDEARRTVEVMAFLRKQERGGRGGGGP